MNLQRHLATDGGHRPATGDHRRLGLELVVDGLDEQQVDTALEQPERLDLVGVAQVGEPDLAERGQLGAGAHRPRHPPGPVGRGVLVGHPPSDRRGREVDLVGLVGDAVLAEGDRKGAEGRRLDGVHADLEERAVHALDDVGPGQDDVFVAAFELGAAEVLGGEVALLDVGAEGAVEHDDALAHCVQIALGHGKRVVVRRSAARTVSGRAERVAPR